MKNNNDKRAPYFFIVGHEGSHNKGCEALVRTCIHIIRMDFPFATFTLASEYPDHDYPLMEIEGLTIVHAKATLPHLSEHKIITSKEKVFIGNIKKFLPSWIKKLIKVENNQDTQAVNINYSKVHHLKGIINECDAVISIGGDMFIDDWGPPLLAIETMEYAQLLNKNTIIWGQSFWKIKNSEIENRIKNLLDKCNIILARDKESIRYLSSIGVINNVKLTADSAFLMEEKNIDLQNIFHKTTKTVIGFNGSPVFKSFLDINQQKEFISSIITFFQYLIDKKKVYVLLIPHDGYPAADERNFLFELNQKINRSNFTKIAPIGLNAPEVKGYINNCKFFISMRFHASIASLSQGIPTISFGYSPKFSYLFSYLFGTSDYVLQYKDINLKTLTSLFNNLESEEGEIKKMLDKNINYFQKLALDNTSYIYKILNIGK